MSASIDTREIPAHTIQQVTTECRRTFIEAWAKVDSDMRALKAVYDGLCENRDVLLEAKESATGRGIYGVRRISWLDLHESQWSGRPMLVLSIAFDPPVEK